MSSLKFSFPRRSVVAVPEDGASEELDGEWTKLYHPSTMPLSRSSWLPRRPSLSSPAPKHRDPDPDPDPFAYGYGHGYSADLLDVKSADSSTSATAHDSSHSAPPHSSFLPHSASLPARHRTSLLSAASDALGLRKKIGVVSRKKPSPYSPPTSNVVPGVIEICSSTPHQDFEHEERERLRDVAAQSIGLDPELLHSSKSESHSLDSPESPPQPAPLPSFPATIPALYPFTELSATLPKFTPPSSLLVYALAKQWKPRTIVLTSHSVNRKTHVHLFKNASKDEIEIERLEVTEDSVIFVAEEEVGGRGNVVKLAGKDVSSKQTAAISEEALPTMWLLQIKDPAEAHRWIAAIKNAVLTQRAVRVGLDIPAQLEGRNEPKGDMDVMLSMHLQRTMSAHPFNTSPPSPSIPTSPSPSSSLRSLRINLSSSSPTTTAKGIFSGTRPRSPSVDGSSALTYPSGHAEDSFSAAGTSLLTMLRTKSSMDSTSSPSHSLPLPPSHVPRQRSPAPSLRSSTVPVIINASDLKISKERDVPEVSVFIPEAASSDTTPGSADATPLTPSISPQCALSFSLQPPPRKYKPAVAAVPTMLLPEPHGMYQQTSGNRSVAGNFGIPSGNTGDLTPRETPLASPDLPEFSIGQPGSFSPSSGLVMPSPVAVEADVRDQNDEATRMPSVNAVVLPDQLSQNAAISKRWSRQGVALPKQPTPPSGPPPSVPPSPENHRFSVGSGVSIPVPFNLDRSPSSSSSNIHSRIRISPRSGSSLSPTFWKRASGSSTQSVSSASTSDSQGRYRSRTPIGPDALHSSVVVGNGASVRPMSLSIHGSSPVLPMGTTKRRSMPPPRPAPNFAPPPAPTVLESASSPATLTTSVPPIQKSFRSSVAQRALRLSLTSPKPPPASALPPRPDEVSFTQGHRRSSSSGTMDIHTISTASSLPFSPQSRHSSSTQRASPPPRNLSFRQRLRILSTPPAHSSPSFFPPAQVSTLDLSDDNDDDLPTPCFSSSHPFGLGEPIMTMQNEPSFLQLSSPIVPTNSKPRSSFRSLSPELDPIGGLGASLLKPDCDFVALSPPPPRRGSRPHVGTVARPERFEVECSGSGQPEESKLVSLSRCGSVVSLGFVTT